MNDINNVSTASSLVLFADDTNIFFSGDNYKRLQDDICNELDKFHDWFHANRLSLNIDKTNYMVFGKLYHKSYFSIRSSIVLIKLNLTPSFQGATSDHSNAISIAVSRSVGILS